MAANKHATKVTRNGVPMIGTRPRDHSFARKLSQHVKTTESKQVLLEIILLLDKTRVLCVGLQNHTSKSD